MNQSPTPRADAAADQVSKASLVNRIVVLALLAVGLIGGWVMFDAIYTPGQPLPLTLKQGAPATKTKAESATAARTETAAPGARSGESQYVLQMNVSNAVSAEDLRARLERHGIPSTIDTHVNVGPFKTQEGVDAARVKLKALGLEGGVLVTTTK